MNKLYPLLLVLAFMTALSGCSKDESLPQVTDPQKAILGKWEIIANGNGPIHYPGSFEEYRADNVLFARNSDGETFYDKYWIVDSLLYKSHVYIDLASGDTILVDIQAYKYDFISYNKLKQVWQQPALNPTHIYKRKE